MGGPVKKIRVTVLVQQTVERVVSVETLERGLEVARNLKVSDFVSSKPRVVVAEDSIKVISVSHDWPDLEA